MTLILPKTCNMGGSKTGLSGTIGITLLNPDGTVHTARATTGIYEIGGGCYGKYITFPDDWKGSLKWDTGGGSPVYASEDYVEGLVDKVETGISDIKGIGFVKDTHSLPQCLSATGFATENPPSQVLADYKADVSNLDVAVSSRSPVGEYDTKINQIHDTLIIRSGTVTTVVSQYLEFNTDLTEASSNYWTRGAIRWTSGNNEGIIRKIQLYQGSMGYIKLRTESINSIQAGDTFDIISLRAFKINHEDVEQVVDEMWDELKSGHTIPDSFGDYIDDEISSRADQNPPSQVLGDYKADVSGLATSGEYDVRLGTLQTDVTYLKDEAIGKWEITSSNQMIFYTEAGIELTRYNLFDAAGAPATANVMKRERV